MGRVRIGISGWNYADWRGDFYPASLPRADELSYATDRFETLEVNATFYALSTSRSFRRWYRAAPTGFVFAVKGSRFITHHKKLEGIDTALANFFASGILELGEKLGPILWQLPEQLHFDVGRVDAFLDMLPHDTSAAVELARLHDDRVEEAGYGSGTNHRIRHVLEVRHHSYLCDEMVRTARYHGIALAFSHSAVWPYAEEVTAGFVYLRLHGPRRLYASPYGRRALRRWADRIERWHDGGEPVDPVRISDLVPPRRNQRDVYVYFDNDRGGWAPREAALLRAMIARSRTNRSSRNP